MALAVTTAPALQMFRTRHLQVPGIFFVEEKVVTQDLLRFTSLVLLTLWATFSCTDQEIKISLAEAKELRK